MRLCYVCSPIRSYYERGRADQAKAHAKELALKVKAMGYIPISTPLLFIDIYKEGEEREEALRASLRVLTTCHALAYRECDLIISEGIKCEVEEAKARGMEVIKL